MFMGRAYHKNWGLCNLRWDASLVGMSKETTLDDTTGLPVVPAGVFWHVDQGPERDGELSLRFRQEGGPTTLATVVLPDSSDQAKTILGASYLALELADKNHRDLIDVYVKRPKKAFSEFEGEFE